MALRSFLDSWNVTTNGSSARTGYGFQPKAGICWTSGRVSTSDAIGLSSIQSSIGVFSSASARRAVGFSLTHNIGTSQIDSGSRADAILYTITNAGTGALDGLLDITSLDSDGLTPAVDDAFANDVRVHLLAWGGEDIQAAEVVSFNQPTSTGNFDVTTVGFEPDAVIIISALGIGDPPVVVGGGGQQIGFFVKRPDGTLQNAVVSLRAIDGQTTPHSQGHARGDLCVAATQTTAGTGVIVRGTGTAMLTNGFRINFAEVDANSRRFFALCIKGGRWEVGSVLSQTSTSQFSVTGLQMAPRGALFASRLKAENASDTGTVDAGMSLGAFSTLPSLTELAHGYFDNDASDPAVCTTAVRYSDVYVRPAQTGGSLDGAFGVVSANSDGFTLQHSDADPDQAYVAFLAWGDQGVATDGLLAGDSFSALVATVASIAEGALLGDARTGVMQESASLTDGVLLGDTRAATAAATASITEGLRGGDSAGQPGATAQGARTDGALLGESLAALVAAAAAITEGARLGESWAALPAAQGTISEGARLGDALDALVAASASLAEGLAAGDTFAGSADDAELGAITEGMSAGDVLAALASAAGSLADGLLAGDTRAATAAAQGSVSDGSLLGDAHAAVAAVAVLLADGVLLGDAFTGETEGMATRALTEGTAAGDAFLAACAAASAVVEGTELGAGFSSLVAAAASVLAQGMLAGDTYSAISTSGNDRSIAEGARAGDLMSALAAAVAQITDGVRLGDTWIASAAAVASIADEARLGDAMRTASFAFVTATISLVPRLAARASLTPRLHAETTSLAPRLTAKVSLT